MNRGRQTSDKAENITLNITTCIISIINNSNYNSHSSNRYRRDLQGELILPLHFPSRGWLCGWDEEGEGEGATVRLQIPRCACRHPSSSSIFPFPFPILLVHSSQLRVKLFSTFVCLYLYASRIKLPTRVLRTQVSTIVSSHLNVVVVLDVVALVVGSLLL